MKVFLDDERQTPKGWERTYSVDDTISLLLVGDVEELSLDHDLGDEVSNGTGYDVLLWIERQVVENGYIPPTIYVHSANPPARKRMEQAVEVIKRFSA